MPVVSSTKILKIKLWSQTYDTEVLVYIAMQCRDYCLSFRFLSFNNYLRYWRASIVPVRSRSMAACVLHTVYFVFFLPVDIQHTPCPCWFFGNPYLHDRRTNKTRTTRKRLQNHTPRNPSLKLLCVLFSYSLLCALLGGRWWRSSVFRSTILFWISSAIQQQTPQANTTATGTAAAGQQRPRAPTTPAGNTPSR